MSGASGGLTQWKCALHLIDVHTVDHTGVSNDRPLCYLRIRGGCPCKTRLDQASTWNTYSMDMRHSPTGVCRMIQCRGSGCFRRWRDDRLKICSDCAIKERRRIRRQRSSKPEVKKPSQRERFIDVGIWCRHGCCDLSDPTRRCSCRC
mgnify:CR=1 FL=1